MYQNFYDDIELSCQESFLEGYNDGINSLLEEEVPSAAESALDEREVTRNSARKSKYHAAQLSKAYKKSAAIAGGGAAIGAAGLATAAYLKHKRKKKEEQRKKKEMEQALREGYYAALEDINLY